MSKILFVGDLHLGIRDDSPWYQMIQRKFFKGMIEYCLENNIKNVVQSGDMFDTRKAVTQECMNFAKQMVLMLADAGITMDVIIGNHDMHKKEKITPNSVSEILRGYDHIRIYEKPTTVIYGNTSIDLIPWMCAENTGEILDFIKNTNSDVCMGHWELSGFWFYKGLKSHGISPDFLSKYESVYSGHFHTISKSGNITYIGTPYTLTAGDENDPRGFWEFDTTTREATLIENDDIWHRKFHYPDDDIDPALLKNKAVRIFAKSSDAALVKLEGKLEEVVFSLRTVVDNISFGEISTDSDEEGEDDEINNASITSLGHKFIDSKDDLSDDEKQSLKAMFDKLYLEARRD